MMKPLFLLALLLAAGLPARSGEGHDHDAPAAAAAAPALPRFAASSELFELVGVLDGRSLTLYLDRAADNAPVTDASLELELGGARLKAAPKAGAAGEFSVQLAQAPRPGLVPVTATVTAGADSDLLAGELDLHGSDDGGHAGHGEASATRWQRYGGAALAVLGAGAALIFGLRRRASA
ncbi:MAG TPA: hypothetical protein VJN44_02095 [Roseateles sp.]|nr:hypothetical protein [Roseateles sp.]